MMNGDGCLTVFLVLFGISVWYSVGHEVGEMDTHTNWRECRTLLATQDSTAVLAARPACAQRTWPPKEDTR